MWFAFGIISLISFSIYFGIKRYRNIWDAKPATVSGISYLYNTVTYKGNVTAIFIGCYCPVDIDLTIKKETRFDRFFKFFGVSVEHQVGREEFDDEIYIISDHPEVCAVLNRSTALQEKIRDLMNRVEFFGKLKGLHIGDNKIWVRLAPRKSDFSDTASLAREFVPVLRGISKEFQYHLQHLKTGLRDPFFWKAAAILAISTGMAITGVVHFLGLTWVKIPFTIDDGNLLAMGFLTGSVITGTLVFLTLLFLGRTARTHLVILELITIGYLGSVATSTALARDINMEWDTAQPEQHVVQVMDKRISKGRKGRKSYYLEVNDWADNKGWRSISVTSSVYYKYQKGDKLEIHQHPGHLGSRWVSEIRPYRESVSYN